MECRNLRGFTLPELLVTITLIAALSFSLPSLVNFLTRARINQFQDGLFLLVQRARLHAVTQRKRVTICPLGADQRCQRNWNGPISSFEDMNGNRRLDPDEQLISTLEREPRVEVSWRGMGGNRSIHLNLQGHTAVTNGRLRICSNGHVIRDLVLNRQGRLRRGLSKGSQC
ncbi:GspH/FimT family pseudopilin [Pseudomonas sp. Q1-7]|uniref:GspH/FimT family pseudopilin n=1 Tax=Pseudomonas sp. Q1-7 TaxID=3020843 RepID=UPI003FA6D282